MFNYPQMNFDSPLRRMELSCHGSKDLTIHSDTLFSMMFQSHTLFYIIPAPATSRLRQTPSTVEIQIINIIVSLFVNVYLNRIH